MIRNLWNSIIDSLDMIMDKLVELALIILFLSLAFRVIGDRSITISIDQNGATEEIEEDGVDFGVEDLVEEI